MRPARRRHPGVEIQQVRQRHITQTRQHQRRAFVRPDTDAGAGDRVARQCVGDFLAGADGGMGLFRHHRRRDARIAGSMGNLARLQPGVRRGGLGHAAIDHGQFESLQPRVDGHRQLRVQQARDQRRCRCMPRTDAIDSQAVVGGKQRDLRCPKPRPQRVLYQSEAQRQRLEQSEAAVQFGTLLQLEAQRLLELQIRGRRDHGERHLPLPAESVAARPPDLSPQVRVAAVRGFIEGTAGRRDCRFRPRTGKPGPPGTRGMPACRRAAPGCRPECGRSRRPGCGSGTS